MENGNFYGLWLSKMDVPVSCSGWGTAMEGDPRSAAVLANIQADRCVPDEAQRVFFASLEGRRFASAEEAWEAACKTVEARSSDLIWSGT